MDATKGRTFDGDIDTGFELRDIAAPVWMVQKTLAATASGIIVTTFPQLPYNVFWKVEICPVSCNSTTQTTAFVYVELPLIVDNLVSTSVNGNQDQDDRNQVILVEPTKSLSVQWINASLGSIGTARIQVRQMSLYPARVRSI